MWHRDEEFVGQALPLAILIQSAGGNARPTKMQEIGDMSRFAVSSVKRPWIIALAAAIGIVRGIRRSRRHREN